MQDYLTGHKEIVWGVHYVSGPWPRLVASTGQAVFVWRLGQAEPIAGLPWNFNKGEDHRAMIVSISPDQRWMLGVTTKTLHLWNMTQEIPTLFQSMDYDRVLAAGFTTTPDELMLVMATELRAEAVRMVIKKRSIGPKGKAVPLLTSESWASSLNAVYLSWLREAMTVSADGRYFTGSPRTREIPVWDVADGRVLGEVNLRRSPTRLALSDDGSLFALDAGTTIYVYETKTFTKVSSWKTKYTYYPSLAWSPDRTILARADSSTTLRLYEVATGRELTALTNKKGRNTAVAFAPDGLTCLVGTFDGKLRMWDVG